MQTASSKIWTQITKSTSYNNNCYTTNISVLSGMTYNSDEI